MQDVASSSGALNSLQGTILHSSQAGEGMRLEYPLFICVLFLIDFFFEGCCVDFVVVITYQCFHDWYLLNKNLRYAKSRMGMRKKPK